MTWHGKLGKVEMSLCAQDLSHKSLPAFPTLQLSLHRWEAVALRMFPAEDLSHKPLPAFPTLQLSLHLWGAGGDRDVRMFPAEDLSHRSLPALSTFGASQAMLRECKTDL